MKRRTRLSLALLIFGSVWCSLVLSTMAHDALVVSQDFQCWEQVLREHGAQGNPPPSERLAECHLFSKNKLFLASDRVWLQRHETGLFLLPERTTAALTARIEQDHAAPVWSVFRLDWLRSGFALAFGGQLLLSIGALALYRRSEDAQP